MRDLIRLLSGEGGDVALDVAALQLAQVEHPDSSLDEFLILLDSHAFEFAERISRDTDGEEFVYLFNEYLFAELGFSGDRHDYYNPANSCLNDVLTRRLGIPIALSVVYMEIARRLHRTVQGIGLPGHFIVKYDDGDFAAYIDPFHKGAILKEEDCYALARRIGGRDSAIGPSVLQPVDNRQIVMRMLNNLRAVYLRRENPMRAIEILNLLIQAEPASPQEYKQRGICLAQVKDFENAQDDLETYLRLAPKAEDWDQISQKLRQIRRLA